MPRSRLTFEERRSDIIKNASRLFALYGMDGASMRDIARACHVNEALLYRHFDNKDDLYREVISHVGGKIDSKLRKVAAESSTGLEALKGIISNLLFGPDEMLHVYACLVHGMTASTKQKRIRELVRGSVTQLHQLFSEAFESGIKDGSIKPDIDVVKCSWCLLSRGMASRILAVIMPDESPLSTTESELMETLLSCLNPPQDRACSSIVDAAIYSPE